MTSSDDTRFMHQALALARRGQGYVEPNPLVGCVIASGGQVVAEGFHQRYGAEHAEIAALLAAGKRAAGATLYVTLEPCCHYGKTPPCTEAIVPAGIKRVVAAMRDPFPQVAGGGVQQLQGAGVAVEVGVCEAEARELNAPYLKLLATSRPWVIAKWAMTLDGKIATRSGYSKWISSEASRGIAHELRGRVDAIVVGRRTAQMDDPLLTARPAATPLPSGEGGSASAEPCEGMQRGPQSAPPRVATRIVIDSQAQLGSQTQLVRTARQTPTLIAAGPEAPERDLQRLRAAGCEVLSLPGSSQYERLLQLLDELGRRRMTNILVEGGARLFGTLLDARQIDEVHAFIAPKLFGGERAPSPIGGAGIEQVAAALTLRNVAMRQMGDDVYVWGRVQQP
jgi:diaminohydroxyphosphoribosylaminopyrimidine deaminase/5-amino-6-(5-phosphoribosylamino)uracil reductase